MSAGAAAAHLRSATVVCGTIVHMEPDEFLLMLAKIEVPLVVVGREPRLFLAGDHQYLTSYRGLAFYTTSTEPLNFPGPVEMLMARRIWAPRF